MTLKRTKTNNEKQIRPINKNKYVAELSGLILGDGSIISYTKGKGVSTHCLEITLNSKEKLIIQNAANLIQRVFSEKPNVDQGEGNTARVTLAGKQVVLELQKIGLKIGNKKRNQVEVPNWIRKDGIYSKKCLRGLTDSDGSIYMDKRENNSYKRISFKNASSPLLSDYIDLCKKNNIRAYHGGKNQVQVSRKDIEKFIEKIRPIKNNLLTEN